MFMIKIINNDGSIKEVDYNENIAVARHTANGRRTSLRHPLLCIWRLVDMFLSAEIV